LPSDVITAEIPLQPWSPAPSGQRPNILVIFGDDIGMWNVGAYCNGMMGRTPNIDLLP
jgi:arylsulfatase